MRSCSMKGQLVTETLKLVRACYLIVELSCYWQTVVLCQWTVWCFLVKGVLKDCFQPLI